MPVDTVDWQEQWQLFSPHFSEGLCWISLSPERSFPLLPGPGFGDFSHPTTRLCLHLLQDSKLKIQQVVDIGSGSGILSVAAAHLGAVEVFGIDIDCHSVDHAKANFFLQLEKGFFLSGSAFFGLALPPSFHPSSSLVICMNMIFCEQKVAWESHKERLSLFQQILTSGILVEQEEEYLSWALLQGWVCVERREEEGWLAFLFKKGF